MKAPYVQLHKTFTQENIQSLIQSTMHLKYHIPSRSELKGFTTNFEGTYIDFYPTSIDFNTGDVPGPVTQIRWELATLADASVPSVTNLTPIPADIIQPLGRVLRHWIDTLQ